MSDPSEHSLLVRCLKGETQWIHVFRTREHGFTGDSFLRLRLGCRHRNEEIVKRGSRARRTASEAKGIESVIRDLGFEVRPVLVIDAKATEHILHRHEIGKMKDIDIAHLWLQDAVESKRLKVRCVKSEDNSADIGTKALMTLKRN